MAATMNLEKLKTSLVGISYHLNYSLKEFCTFKVGGSVDILIVVKNDTELARVLQSLRECEIPWIILGKGSNLLILDEGVMGAVITLEGEYLDCNRLNDTNFVCGAGMSMLEVGQKSLEYKLSGLEFAAGIPGSLGGGVFMNAGAYDGEIANAIANVYWMDEAGEIEKYSTENCKFEYRKSVFQRQKGVILRVELSGNVEASKVIQSRMQDLAMRRKEKQPLEYPSAGSTFKRPPGFFAGTLIQDAGLKGVTHGGAQVSEKHAGFVINKGNATAKDILNLIDFIRKRVYDYAGVWLIPEVKIIGKGKEKWDYFYQS